MGSLLGFRPPQFSEEAAWLPTLLQHQNAESVDELINRGETSFKQRIKELKFLGHTTDQEQNALISSSSDGYRSCHLLLSGDESSPFSSLTSAKNVVHVHLHWSSDGNSQSMPSEFVESSLPQRIASYVAAVKQAHETSVIQDGTTNQSILEKDADVLNCSPVIRPDNETELMRHEGNKRCIDVDEVNDIVELSIAASEAVLIHEMLTESVLESLPVSTLLEVASQVKKARLDVCKQNLHTGVTCEVDNLLDMDDSTMADAYEDVGLCIGDLGPHNHDHSVSKVGHVEIDRRGECLEHETTIRSLDYGKQKLKEVVNSERHLRDAMVSVVSDDNRQKKLSKEPSIRSGFIMDSQNDPIANISVHETLHASTLVEIDKNVQVGDCGIGEQSFFQEHVQSSLAKTSEDAEKHDMVLDKVPSRYQSRWFGGWTWKKEVTSSPPLRCGNAKVIPVPLIGETSFLSESADIAPDENSFVHNQDGGILTSHSSYPSVVLRNKTDAETLLSQDIVRCSILSPCASSDPLCSIVPCSISPENTISTSTVNHEGNLLSRRCTRGTAEYTIDNLLGMTTSQNELVYGKKSNTAVAQSEKLQPPVYRKLSSLSTYSVLQPSPWTTLVRESCPNKRLLLDRIPKNSIIEDSVSHLANKENCNTVMEEVAKSQILKEKQLLPRILYGGSNCHSQSFCGFRSDFGCNEKSLIQDTGIDLLPSKDTDKLCSNCRSEYNAQVPSAKRVRFLECETNYGPKRTLQKQPRSLKICCPSRAAKRSRSYSGARGCKSCKLICLERDENRLIFQNMDFLLTGFSRRKEKELEDLIRNHGGIVLSDTPSPLKSRGKSISTFNHHKLPIILSPKKLQSIKFLYGCAVNTFVLKVAWLTDSIKACSLLSPQRYAIFPRISCGNFSRTGEPIDYNGHQPIFGNVAIMLHGKNRFCIEMAKIIKHGGGQVCKTLNSLVNSLDLGRISMGAIVAENETRTSRHLKHCALERKIPVLSNYWIIKSLHRGKLLPFKESSKYPLNVPQFPTCVQPSEEI